MVRVQPNKVCFVVLPDADASVAGVRGEAPDFDSVFGSVERAVLAAGLFCVRTEFSGTDGFLYPSMRERLLIADVVIVDVTVTNPDVAYMVGVRHGVDCRPTILIGDRGDRGETATRTWRSDVVGYEVGDGGAIDPEGAVDFEGALGRRLARALNDDTPAEIPLLDATGWALGRRLEHDKTDVFIERIATTTDVGRRIRNALEMSDRTASVDALYELEGDLLGGSVSMPDLDTGLLGVYIAYRERAAYQHMVDLNPRMPPELQSTPVVREQLALALNRLAEAGDADGVGISASRLRTAALDSLDALDGRVVTAETWAIRGRIYKSWFLALVASGEKAEASDMLAQAIDSYERAMSVDMRDYFPGVNAVTLRMRRGSPQDMEAIERILPVVRMAVENAPGAQSDQERYWQVATKLEMACAARDWNEAVGHAESAIRLDVDDWMRETTINNLGMYRGIFGGDASAVTQVDYVIERLKR